MEKISKALIRLFAGTFAILFVITTGFAFVLYNIEQSVFDPALYIQAFEKENVYQRFPKLTAQAMYVAAQEAESVDPLALLRNLSEEEWGNFLGKLLPPENLEVLAEDAVIQLMAFLNGEIDAVEISLIDLKAHLQSPQGVDAIYGLLEYQPDCTLEQLGAMAAGTQEMVLCNPPESFLFVDLRPIYKKEIETAVELMVPEQLELIPVDPGNQQQINELKNLRTIIRLSPFLPMLCLLTITIVAVRSLGDWLNWWGYPLWFAGLFSMALTIISGLITALIFQAYVAPLFPASFPPDLLHLLESIVVTIAYDAVQPMVSVAGIMALIGMIMVIVAYLFRKRLQKSQVNSG